MANKKDHASLMYDTSEKMYSKKYFEKIKKLLPVMIKMTKTDNYERFLINAKAILNFDVRKDLHKIECPTFVISGNEDNTIGNEAPKEFENKIKNNVIYIYDGLGHGIFEEAKDFYDRVYEFCEK